MPRKVGNREPLWIAVNVVNQRCIWPEYKCKSTLSKRHSVIHLLPTSTAAMTTYTALGKVTHPAFVPNLIGLSKNRAVRLYSFTSYHTYFYQHFRRFIS